MNLQYVKYALEIARTGSISKAAENLSVAQPNLSRAVKELEGQLGISIFERTRTGMTVTPEGEKLLSAGERILREVGELETMFSGESRPRRSFSFIGPSSVYLSHAFMSFACSLPAEERFDLIYREAAADEILEQVTSGACKLGILRIPLHFEKYYTEKLAARELKAETVADFSPVAVAVLGSALAGFERVTPHILADYCEIQYPDAPRPEGADGDRSPRRTLLVTEQSTRLSILTGDPTAYQFDAPMPGHLAAERGLIQRPVHEGTPYRDLLVTQAAYRLTNTDEAFLRALRGTVRSLQE